MDPGKLQAEGQGGLNFSGTEVRASCVQVVTSITEVFAHSSKCVDVSGAQADGRTPQSHALLEEIFRTLRESRVRFLHELKVDPEAIAECLLCLDVALTDEPKDRVEARRQALVSAVEENGECPFHSSVSPQANPTCRSQRCC